MQPRFKYEPPIYDERVNKNVEPAQFSFVIKDNGAPVDLPFCRFDKDKLSFSISPLSSGSICFVEKPEGILHISTNGTGVQEVFATNCAQELLHHKETIKALVKQIKDNYKPLIWEDVDTGLPVEHKITGEYSFQDEVVTETSTKVLAVHGWVFFDCKQSFGQVYTGHCKAGKVIYPSAGKNSDKEWHFEKLGKIVQPEVIKWTAEEIEEAFRDLAKALLAGPEDPSVQTWKTKEVAKISLE